MDPRRPRNLTERYTVVSKSQPPPWKPDDLVNACEHCRSEFWFFSRKHHCRNCGGIFCGNCCDNLANLSHFGFRELVRVCLPCFRKLNAPEPELRKSVSSPRLHNGPQIDSKIDDLKAIFSEAISGLNQLESEASNAEIIKKSLEEICRTCSDKLSSTIPLPSSPSFEFSQQSQSQSQQQQKQLEELNQKEGNLKKREEQILQREQQLRLSEEKQREREGAVQEKERNTQQIEEGIKKERGVPRQSGKRD
eukprot:TRINITY_DN6814_c0_g1_i1.p1 TRINITY_DN6814_c0_g1~~TRINITY_DN6814_c0_g1_i1.p1  ORF type:complete len:250 (+),score=62.38 TRINITY_DN6814_c0_g1_i1:109-858(+)